MKWYSIKILLLLLLTIAINSCKKEVTKPTELTLITLNEAKSFFNNEVVPNSPLTLASKDLSTQELLANPDVNDLLYKEPIWEKAYKKSVNGSIGIAVPIHFKLNSFIRTGEKTGVNFDNLNYLFIYKNNTNNLIAEWVTLSPDITWIQGDRSNYKGRIKIADWDGNLKRMLVFDGKGEITSYRKPTNDNLLLNYYKNQSLFSDSRNIMGRKYKDNNGDCWEDLREVQSSGGIGVTLHRKGIDCAELDEESEKSLNPVDNNNLKPGTGSGGGSKDDYDPKPCLEEVCQMPPIKEEAVVEIDEIIELVQINIPLKYCNFNFKNRLE